ncbi:hypothetical protein HZB89_01865 [archaeon]|nr:hypothetical protein [archaeon]
MDLGNLEIGVKDVGRLVVLIALLLGLLLVVTWAGFIKCNSIPGWCGVYESVFGKPKIAIVFGSDGLGDPTLLRQALADPKLGVGVRPEMISLSLISFGNLEPYDLIIVEHAATMTTEQLKAFRDYVTQKGGRLIWVADSATKLGPKDQYLLKQERAGGVVDPANKETIGPWSRKTSTGEIISFDELLGVNFAANYCSLKPCTEGKEPFIGNLIPTKDNPLVYGLSPFLQLHGDFSIVEDYGTGTRALSVDYQSALIDLNKGISVGPVFPLIVQSGLGGKVAYYAVPPETFVKDSQKEKFYSIVQNMYLGILGYVG